MGRVKARMLRTEETAFLGGKPKVIPHSEHISDALHNAAYYMGKHIKKAKNADDARNMGEAVYRLHQASKFAEGKKPEDMHHVQKFVAEHGLHLHVQKHGYMTKAQKEHFHSFMQGESHKYKE